MLERPDLGELRRVLLEELDRDMVAAVWRRLRCVCGRLGRHGHGRLLLGRRGAAEEGHGLLRLLVLLLRGVGDGLSLRLRLLLRLLLLVRPDLRLQSRELLGGLRARGGLVSNSVAASAQPRRGDEGRTS